MTKRKQTMNRFISPEGDEILKKALRESVRLELRRLEALPETVEMGNFSLMFEERMKKVFPMVTRRYASVGRRTVRRAALIAVIMTLILAASAIVIAVTVPQIHYIIFKSNISWDMFFEQEDPEGLTQQEFQPIKPTFPEGYEVVEEINNVDSYSMDAVNAEGNHIFYDQLRAEGSGVTMNAEGESVGDITIDGHRFVIQANEPTSAILFEDGYYIYLINGDCDTETLIEIGKSVLDK